MKLTNGTDTIELADEIQIRAYLSSGYVKVEGKPALKRGGKSGDTKSGTT